VGALVFVKKDTFIPIKVIDKYSLFSRHVTHETNALEITIGSHISKMVLNVISSPKNPIIIGLSWLALHTPQMD